jgi:hypothetical protein
LRLQATQEGLVPLRAWIKGALDEVIQVYLNAPDLEFVWVGDDAVDPLQQAQTLNILVSAGIKAIAEARAEQGLAPGAKAAASAETKPALDKFNPYHDERGRFATADDAVEPGVGGANAPEGAQVAANDDRKTKGDASQAPAADPEADPSSSSVALLSRADRSICRARCSALALPTGDFGIQFQRCILACESGGKSGFPEWDRLFR